MKFVDKFFESLPPLIFLLIFLSFIGLAVYSCFPHSDPRGATNVLNSAGYKDIHITEPRFFGKDGNFYSTGFEAKNANGKKVTGMVTRGYFTPNSTIRIDSY